MSGFLEQMMSGMNQGREIANLWYEVTYLRFLLIDVLEKNPEIGKCVTEESIHQARLKAQEIVAQRFPDGTLKFTEEHVNSIKEVLDEEMPY